MLKQIAAGTELASMVALPALAGPKRMSSGQLDELVAGTRLHLRLPSTGRREGKHWLGQWRGPE
jgi:hypothetical protein